MGPSRPAPATSPGIEPSPAPSRVAGLAHAAWRAARRASGPALLGAWLVAKQLLWSPPLQGDAPLRAGAVAASAAVALLVIGLAVRFRGRAQLLVLLAADGALTAVYQVHLLHHRQFSELASVAALTLRCRLRRSAARSALFRPGDALLWADVAALAVVAAVAGGRAPRLVGRRHATRWRSWACCSSRRPRCRSSSVRSPGPAPRRHAAEVAATLNVVGYQLFDAATFVRRRLDRSGRGSLPEALAYHQEREAQSSPSAGPSAAATSSWSSSSRSRHSRWDAA
jgi:hypothetical protein